MMTSKINCRCFDSPHGLAQDFACWLGTWNLRLYPVLIPLALPAPQAAFHAECTTNGSLTAGLSSPN